MKKIAVLFFILVLTFSLYGQSDQSKRSMSSIDCVIAKNFYFTYLINKNEDVRQLLNTDEVLKQIANHKGRIIIDREECLLLDSVMLSDYEVDLIAKRLGALYHVDNALGELVTKYLKPSGAYNFYRSLPDRELMVKAWVQDAQGINNVIAVYGKGQQPRYPNIDSISYDVTSKGFKNLLCESQNYILECMKVGSIFCSVPMLTVQSLLDINDRYEASDFEPLGQTVNKKSYEKMQSIKWEDYDYSSLLVLGSGPTKYDEVLSPIGKLRLRTAAIKFHEGLAPLIIVSGGRVHPYKTKINESYSMKQFLIEQCRIPEDAIIMEPHARHTTTNIRNTARILMRNNIPEDKKFLIVSSVSHIDYVCSESFLERCVKEMGIVPFRLGKRIGGAYVEMFVDDDALYINPIDPLDP